MSVMKFLLLFAILLGIANNKFISADADIYQSIRDDLRNLNVTCPLKDSCMEARWGKDDLDHYSCHCSQFCTRLNSCCYDSPYIFVKPPKVVQTCTKISDTEAYFMVDRCPESDSVWERLCREEWNGEDDAVKLVPVTSFFTHITYKNYYCFRCHEAGEDFLYWGVELRSNDCDIDEILNGNATFLNYNQTSSTWMATLGIGDFPIPVNISIERSWEFHQLIIECTPDVISRCSDEWTDKDAIDKCEAYMAMVYITNYSANYSQYIWYRNAHCALCNFESLVNLSCDGMMIPLTEMSEIDQRKKPFSFTHLLDVNRSDGDEVGKVRKCETNFVWDPFAKKCRELACALPGYVVRDGKCTPP